MKPKTEDRCVQEQYNLRVFPKLVTDDQSVHPACSTIAPIVLHKNKRKKEEKKYRFSSTRANFFKEMRLS